jgi:hypothetical protein
LEKNPRGNFQGHSPPVKTNVQNWKNITKQLQKGCSKLNKFLFDEIVGVFNTGGGELCPEKFCPVEILPGKILSQSLFCPGKILSRPAGMGKKYRPARSAGNF